MNDEVEPDRAATNDREESVQGVNLKLIYSLIAFALLAAIAIALFIVMPFYQRR